MNPEQCIDFLYMIPEYTSDMERAIIYIKEVIDRNILLMHKWLDNVKNIDNSIEVINQRIPEEAVFNIPWMQYVRAFLYAKNKNVEDAMLALQQCYRGRMIPQILIDKINLIASE